MSEKTTVLVGIIPIANPVSYDDFVCYDLVCDDFVYGDFVCFYVLRPFAQEHCRAHSQQMSELGGPAEGVD